MHRSSFKLRLFLIVAALFAFGITQIMTAQSRGGRTRDDEAARTRQIRQADRKAAAKRRTAATGQTIRVAGAKQTTGIFSPGMRPGGVPDYFNVANYANSPLPVLDAAGNVVPGTGIRKFVDSLPGLTAANANNLGQFIPIANPITGSPGVPADGDYYEVGLFDYTQQLHSDLPPTLLRGYRDMSPASDGKNHYLGPLIIAQRGRPVRLKFTNDLGVGTAGNLFIPVDTTLMGAGLGPDGTTMYSENRAVIHLHGGHAVWISDGTPHQWITPAGESGPAWRLTGASHQHVPDMPDPGPGATNYFWTNDQSSRLMFFHDHSYGITRLNVYAGEAAGYLLWDQTEEDLISGTNVTGINPSLKKVIPDLGGVYHYGIPLIIQDKTFLPDPNFVPATGQKFSTVDPTWGTGPGGQLAAQDPTWNTTAWSANKGSLWYPHVYTPNQNPSDLAGANAFGRWDYGPWFWPPLTATAGLKNGEVMGNGTNGCAVGVRCLGTPNPSLTPEAFMDTPVINGTLYPFINVQRRAYRFRILNAANDRAMHIGFYYADPAHPTEMKMVPAVATPGFPATWPTDGRDGGVPDPATVGPDIIQIGNESGFLPNPVVHHSVPIGYEYDRRSITVLNVSTHSLLLGPAERADVIVDFSGVPDGSTLILYNDGPAPIPAFDTRIDYYTGDPDQTDIGGAPTTIVGYGPNTRTLMQVRVAGPASAPFDLVSLQSLLNAAFEYDQPQPIVAEPANAGVGTGTYVRIQDTTVSANGVTYPLQPKAIQELFELNYGRMNATLGVELPLTNFNTQTTIPLGYIDPVTEIVTNGSPQLWKITHNGVDTHFVHFHLSDVQVVNRIGWDGVVKPPDDNEIGWKDTVRMNPLEDIVVAIRPTVPGNLPAAWPTAPNGSKLPDSVRLLDPTSPAGATLSLINPADGNATSYTNQLTSFGWEYVWHCHILGHEENDMMRPVVFDATPTPPEPIIASVTPGSGPAAGGTVLTITGSNFPAAPEIWVGGVKGTVLTNTATRITAATPPNTAGLLADVVVATPGNVKAPQMQGLTITPNAGIVTRSLAFAYLGGLTATAITPPAAPVVGGVPVTITGSNFVPGLMTVTFDGISATAVAVTSTTSLSAVVPAHAAGVVDVVVSDGTSTVTMTQAFTYGGPPAVTAMTPTTGPNTGGTVVVITGNGFIPSVTTVTIGGLPATAVTVNAPTMLTAVTPPGAVGAAAVAVTTPGGSGSLAGSFTYYSAVSTSAVSPASGPTAGGTAVTITAAGTSFVAGVTTVTIGVNAATSVNITSATTLTCVTPAGVAGPAAIFITTPPGPAIPLAGSPFLYLPAPTITGIAPPSGALAGGTLVTITGTGFVVGNTQVTIGGVPATAISVTSSTSLTAMTPAGIAGPAGVIVTTPGGTATLAGSVFTYLSNAPGITAVTPSRVAVGSAGFTLSVTGTNFLSGATLTWNGSPRTTQVISATQMQATIPASDLTRHGAAQLAVQNPAPTAGASAPMTFVVGWVDGDFNGDGIADVVWRNRVTGEVIIWTSNGAAYGSTVLAGPTDRNWKIAAVADMNGDHKPDLVWRNAATGANQIWMMDGVVQGTTLNLPAVPDASWKIGAAADFNGDGIADIVWHNATTGANIIWYVDAGGYAGYAALPGVSDTNWAIVGAADFNADDKSDLVWRNQSTGQYLAWFMNGPQYTGFASLGTLADLNWRIVGTADYNGDGNADILCRNLLTGANQALYMNGATYVSTGTMPAVTDAEWDVLHSLDTAQPGPADFNIDGRPDILWRNTATGENLIWYMYDVNHVMTDGVVQAFADPNWRSVATGDFNGDGAPDIVWRNFATGENRVWYMNGARHLSDASLPPVAGQDWRICGVADFNGDGKPDLVWRNQVTGLNVIWFMNGTSYTGFAFAPTITDAAWQIEAVADFNGDGQPDLMWRHQATGAVVFWFMINGNYAGWASGPVIDPTWTIVNAADFDGDGKPDVLCRNATSGANMVWYLNGTATKGTATLPSMAAGWVSGPRQ